MEIDQRAEELLNNLRSRGIGGAVSTQEVVGWNAELASGKLPLSEYLGKLFRTAQLASDERVRKLASRFYNSYRITPAGQLLNMASANPDLLASAIAEKAETLKTITGLNFHVQRITGTHFSLTGTRPRDNVPVTLVLEAKNVRMNPFGDGVLRGEFFLVSTKEGDDLPVALHMDISTPYQIKMPETSYLKRLARIHEISLDEADTFESILAGLHANTGLTFKILDRFDEALGPDCYFFESTEQTPRRTVAYRIPAGLGYQGHVSRDSSRHPVLLRAETEGEAPVSFGDRKPLDLLDALRIPEMHADQPFIKDFCVSLSKLFGLNFVMASGRGKHYVFTATTADARVINLLVEIQVSRDAFVKQRILKSSAELIKIIEPATGATALVDSDLAKLNRDQIIAYRDKMGVPYFSHNDPAVQDAMKNIAQLLRLSDVRIAQQDARHPDRITFEGTSTGGHRSQITLEIENAVENPFANVNVEPSYWLRVQNPSAPPATIKRDMAGLSEEEIIELRTKAGTRSLPVDSALLNDVKERLARSLGTEAAFVDVHPQNPDRYQFRLRPPQSTADGVIVEVDVTETDNPFDRAIHPRSTRKMILYLGTSADTQRKATDMNSMSWEDSLKLKERIGTLAYPHGHTIVMEIGQKLEGTTDLVWKYEKSVPMPNRSSPNAVRCTFTAERPDHQTVRLSVDVKGSGYDDGHLAGARIMEVTIGQEPTEDVSHLRLSATRTSLRREEARALRRWAGTPFLKHDSQPIQEAEKNLSLLFGRAVHYSHSVVGEPERYVFVYSNTDGQMGEIYMDLVSEGNMQTLREDTSYILNKVVAGGRTTEIPAQLQKLNELLEGPADELRRLLGGDAVHPESEIVRETANNLTALFNENRFLGDERLNFQFDSHEPDTNNYVFRADRDGRPTVFISLQILRRGNPFNQLIDEYMSLRPVSLRFGGSRNLLDAVHEIYAKPMHDDDIPVLIKKTIDESKYATGESALPELSMPVIRRPFYKLFHDVFGLNMKTAYWWAYHLGLVIEEFRQFGWMAIDKQLLSAAGFGWAAGINATFSLLHLIKRGKQDRVQYWNLPPWASTLVRTIIRAALAIIGTGIFVGAQSLVGSVMPQGPPWLSHYLIPFVISLIAHTTYDYLIRKAHRNHQLRWLPNLGSEVSGANDDPSVFWTQGQAVFHLSIIEHASNPSDVATAMGAITELAIEWKKRTGQSLRPPEPIENLYLRRYRAEQDRERQGTMLRQWMRWSYDLTIVQELIDEALNGWRENPILADQALVGLIIVVRRQIIREEDLRRFSGLFLPILLGGSDRLVVHVLRLVDDLLLEPRQAGVTTKVLHGDKRWNDRLEELKLSPNPTLAAKAEQVLASLNVGHKVDVRQVLSPDALDAWIEHLRADIPPETSLGDQEMHQLAGTIRRAPRPRDMLQQFLSRGARIIFVNRTVPIAPRAMTEIFDDIEFLTKKNKIPQLALALPANREDDFLRFLRGEDDPKFQPVLAQATGLIMLEDKPEELEHALGLVRSALRRLIKLGIKPVLFGADPDLLEEAARRVEIGRLFEASVSGGRMIVFAPMLPRVFTRNHLVSESGVEQPSHALLLAQRLSNERGIKGVVVSILEESAESWRSQARDWGLHNLNKFLEEYPVRWEFGLQPSETVLSKLRFFNAYKDQYNAWDGIIFRATRDPGEGSGNKEDLPTEPETVEPHFPTPVISGVSMSYSEVRSLLAGTISTGWSWVTAVTEATGATIEEFVNHQLTSMNTHPKFHVDQRVLRGA